MDGASYRWLAGRLGGVAMMRAWPRTWPRWVHMWRPRCQQQVLLHDGVATRGAQARLERYMRGIRVPGLWREGGVR